tara:strand:+ start:281 stop:490 length:210 start_codon:yes stop_codon:yes gene_type:complete
MIDNLKTALDTIGTFEHIEESSNSLDIVYSNISLSKKEVEDIISLNIDSDFSVKTSDLFESKYKGNFRK